MRRTLLPLTALALVAALVACGPKSDKGASAEKTPQVETSLGAGESSPGIAPSSSPTATAPASTAPAKARTTAPSTTAPVKRVAALSCGQLGSAYLGSNTAKFNGYADPIPLLEGRWAGEDGVTVILQSACGIGDLTGDGAADALRALMLDGGGTGKFFSIVLWRNVNGKPAYVNLATLGDRTPIQNITISGQRATVVYLTRSDSAPMAELSIRRTAVYKLSGGSLVEVSHTDAPYKP